MMASTSRKAAKVAGMGLGFALLLLAGAALVGGASVHVEVGRLEPLEVGLMALLAGLSLYTLPFADRVWPVRGPLVGAVLCFAVAAVNDPARTYELSRGWGRFDDLSTGLSTAGAGLLLIAALQLARASLGVRALLAAAFSLGVASLCMELLRWDPGHPAGAGLWEISSCAVGAPAMSLLAWSVTPPPLAPGDAARDGASPGGGAAISLALWQGLQSRPGRFLSILWEEGRWRLWHLRRPNDRYADYYARSIEQRLDSGRPHRTLGKHHWDKDAFITGRGVAEVAQFRKRGEHYLTDLIDLGLEPRHRVVDYGCGSLRVGQHLIRFLDPGRYLGLDLTDRFFRDGMELLEPGLVARKQPVFGVIGERTIAYARSLRPDFVISTSVMIHVPPDEIDEYWKNLSLLMAPGSALVVYCDVADRATRTKGRNWAYALEEIEAVVQRALPGASLSAVSMPRSDGSRRPWERTRLTVTAGEQSVQS